MTEPPIACTLSATELPARLADLHALAAEALLAREDVPGGQTLTFAAGEGAEARLRELVAAESRCCAFLEFGLAAGPAALRLTITGPEAARPVIEALFA